MTHPAASVHPHRLPQRMQEEGLGLLLGGAFSFGLFFAVARFESLEAVPPADEIEEIRRVSLPLEPPPPPPTVTQPIEAPAADLPISGIEIGASDSPIKIAVVPPDLAAVTPTTPYVPARAQLATLHAELRPTLNIDADVARVYQESEVDQKPRALVRTAPPIPADVHGSASSLRVVLLLLIDQKGKVTNARVLRSSGKPAFDDLVARCVTNEWLFSPALRRGKKVKVLAEQGFRVNFGGGGSPFGLD